MCWWHKHVRNFPVVWPTDTNNRKVIPAKEQHGITMQGCISNTFQVMFSLRTRLFLQQICFRVFVSHSRWNVRASLLLFHWWNHHCPQRSMINSLKSAIASDCRLLVNLVVFCLCPGSCVQQHHQTSCMSRFTFIHWNRPSQAHALPH